MPPPADRRDAAKNGSTGTFPLPAPGAASHALRPTRRVRFTTPMHAAPMGPSLAATGGSPPPRRLRRHGPGRAEDGVGCDRRVPHRHRRYRSQDTHEEESPRQSHPHTGGAKLISGLLASGGPHLPHAPARPPPGKAARAGPEPGQARVARTGPDHRNRSPRSSLRMAPGGRQAQRDGRLPLCRSVQGRRPLRPGAPAGAWRSRGTARAT